jgi:beta-lactamase class D
MDSDENDLKGKVGTTMSEDTCSHTIWWVGFANNIPYVIGATMEWCAC